LYQIEDNENQENNKVLKSEINNNNNNNKMMKLTVVVIALFCTVHQSEAYFKLFGNLAESNGFPVTLHCPETLGYVLVGGITVNNVPLKDKLQTKVKKQCEKQMVKYQNAKNNVNSDAPSGEGTSCSLSLPSTDVGEDDIVRVVFSCQSAPPSSNSAPIWGEEVKQTNNNGGSNSGGGNVPDSKISTTGKTESAVLTCSKKNEVITIEEVLLGGVIQSEITHPDLVPQQMTDECYSQWTDELNQGQSKKYYPLCTISNSYGEDMKITYVCLGPGDVRKESGDKNGNNGNNGNGNNGNGNNGNGNGNNGNGNGNNGHGNGNNGNGNNGNGKGGQSGF